MTPAPRVVVLDYGSGNLHSATRALAAAGADIVLCACAEDVTAADGLVVPGVGAFAACMDGLVSVGGPELIRGCLARGIPVLGICVGHQVLFHHGTEHGHDAAGLALLPGMVEQLPATRLPHMGWNTVAAPEDSALFAGVRDERFYFVHSFGVLPGPAWPTGARVTWCEHEGARFVAAVEHGLLSSTQFHPEKSGAAGARLLRNWVSGLGGTDAAARTDPA